MSRKGVEFTLLLIKPGLWEWRFQIGETVTTGTTETNLKGMAAHRASDRIDREPREPRSLDDLVVHHSGFDSLAAAG
jgi:hypothetical protein